jgi:Domain of unknown function (DUF4397)
MTRHTTIAALLLAGLVSACGKDALRNITEPPVAASRIRFFNFGVNSPGVNFYAGETKMTAVVSTTGTEATTGIGYGGVGAGGDYMQIQPGAYTVTGRIAAATDKDVPISSVNATIEDGKYYSYYQSGFYNATSKTIDAFVIEDAFAEPTDFSVAMVRFVNAISNANPMTLYAKNTTTSAEVPVGAEIAYKQAGAFVALPKGAYDLSTRYTGATTNALSRPNVSFLGGHVYTITARGDITVAPSTACASTNRTCLDNTANR